MWNLRPKIASLSVKRARKCLGEALKKLYFAANSLDALDFRNLVDHDCRLPQLLDKVIDQTWSLYCGRMFFAVNVASISSYDLAFSDWNRVKLEWEMIRPSLIGPQNWD